MFFKNKWIEIRQWQGRYLFLTNQKTLFSILPCRKKAQERAFHTNTDNVLKSDGKGVKKVFELIAHVYEHRTKECWSAVHIKDIKTARWNRTVDCILDTPVNTAKTLQKIVKQNRNER